MAINYRKHGTKNWEYRIRYKDPISEQIREKSRRGFPSKAEARQAAQEKEKELLNSYDAATEDSLLEHYLYEWLETYKKGVVRKNTYKLHEQNIKNHILPYFQKAKLKAIKPIMYQKFINHLFDQGYATRTIEIIHGTVYNALEKAVQLDRLLKNPCAGADLRNQITKEERANRYKQLKFIDANQVPIFMEEAYKYNYLYWIFFRALIATGLRKGEAAALQWSDIDFKNGKIEVTKTLDFQPDNEGELFGETKTYNSSRIVNLPVILKKDLQLHLKFQNQNKTRLNNVYRHELNLVFCKNDGSPLPKSTLHNAFRKILKNANLPPLSIHSTRHTFAVLQFEAGNSIKYVQEQLGHGSSEITSDIYTHVSKRIDVESVSKFEQRISDIFL